MGVLLRSGSRRAPLPGPGSDGLPKTVSSFGLFPARLTLAMLRTKSPRFPLGALVALFFALLSLGHADPPADPPADSSGPSGEAPSLAGDTAGDRKLRSALQQPKHPETGRSDLEKAISQLPEVEVVAVTPLPGMGQPLQNLPGDYQIQQGKTWLQQEEFSLPEFLERNMASVNEVNINGNPFLPNINYRGFAASPVPGTPVGISVFLDGVRMNEPFTNNVLWDYIPQLAVQSMEVVPGSNPIYGQNTLGGALVLQTKSGRTNPGSMIQDYAGDWGTNDLEFQHGGYKGHWDWFLSGNWMSMEGWRQQSSSYVKQLFAKVGYHMEETDVHLEYLGADNLLNILGPTPADMLGGAFGNSMIYTGPNPQYDNLQMINLLASQKLTDELTLGGNAYFRESNYSFNNGNIANDVYQFLGFNYPLNGQALNAEGMPIPAGEWDFGTIDQTGAGARLQLQWEKSFAGMENYAVAGASFDWAQSFFDSGFYPAAMGPNYNNITIPGYPFENQFAVPTFTDYVGLYLTDTFSPTPWFHLTGALRDNYAQMVIGGTGVETSGEMVSLAAAERFQQVTPAAGFTFQPLAAFGVADPNLKDLTFFFNYSESFRPPMPGEITGANPAIPVILPVAQLGDPVLSPVLAQTFESGFRGSLAPGNVDWALSFYRTGISNNIMFEQTGHSAAGFFQNIGEEQNQGVEITIQGSYKKLTWFANWSFLEATFQSPLVLQNAVSSAVPVQPGNRQPNLPEQMVKAGITYQILPQWQVSMDFQYYSSRVLYGDWSNIYPMLTGFAVLNVQTYYTLNKHCQIFAYATNVYDEHYASAGLISQNVFTGAPNGGTIIPFLTPGSPFGVWGGVRLQF
ncbi:TonB-dependent receptor [Methylacidimicrobium sp. AP8]|uniref:TonB-dependent receptor n=1 Tax=Methylacidimicrobium sp. AP8 TaxID=2730359 RepID=UPI001F370DDF|nr:TonB-dependent receptor [Methylacidimicrobium sp. AP8]